MRGLLRHLLCAVALTGLLGAPLHAKPALAHHFVTFADTGPLGINNKGAVTGSLGPRGFVRQPDGTTELFDVPGSTGRGVVPVSINDSGDVTGYYYAFEKGAETMLGFIRTANGVIKPFHIPQSNGPYDPVVLNAGGTLFGNYSHHKTWYGFARSPDGTTTTLTCPSGRFVLSAANGSGQAVGGIGGYDGVLRGADGSCTPIDAGYPLAINAEGSIAGAIGDPPVTNFLRTPDGSVSDFNIPAKANYVYSVGINANRAITGYFTDLDFYKKRGFVRSPTGRVSVFDAPNSIYTMPYGINDAGAIVGSFQGPPPTQDAMGFIRFP